MAYLRNSTSSLSLSVRAHVDLGDDAEALGLERGLGSLSGLLVGGVKVDGEGVVEEGSVMGL